MTELTPVLARSMVSAEQIYNCINTTVNSEHKKEWKDLLEAIMLDIKGMTGKDFYINAATGKIMMDKD